MARAAVLRRLSWAVAEVVDRVDETARVRSLTFDVPDWPGHLPGQHIDVRLTAQDGYQAGRQYSISTPAEGIRLTELGHDPASVLTERFGPTGG